MSNVDTELLVRHHSECKDLLIEALKYHLMPEQRGVLSNSRTRPRRCEGASPVLFAVGQCVLEGTPQGTRASHVLSSCWFVCFQMTLMISFPVSLVRFCLISVLFSLLLNCVVQVGAACLPSTETARHTTPGQIAGTWWRPCLLGGREWAWQPLGTDSMLLEGE